MHPKYKGEEKEVLLAPWFEKVRQVQRKIAEETSLRVKYLQEQYGIEDTPFNE